MAATQSLHVDFTHGFDMSPGFVTVPITGGTSDGKETRKVKFQKLCDLLKTPSEPGKKISDKFRIALVQAILFSSKHNQSSNSVTEKGIYISEDGSTVNVPRPVGAGSTSLKCQSSTFKFILSRNMISQDAQSIADDFCERVTKGDLTVDGALNHPIFWTAAQKIWYFKKSLSTERQKASSYTAKTMIGGNWIGKLGIDDDVELENFRHSCFRTKYASNLSVEDHTVKKLATENRYYDYDGDSWKDFLAFFRNIHAHFWQQDENVRCCFRNDEHNGYWDFFSKRFPGLFVKVYEKYRHNINFHNRVEPKFLPDAYEQEDIPTSITKTHRDFDCWKNKMRRPVSVRKRRSRE